jgi:hypothetical protein
MGSKNRMGVFFVIIFLAFATVVYTFFITDRPMTLTDRAQERAAALGRQLIENQFVIKVNVPDENQKANDSERNLASQRNDSFEMNKKVSDGEIGRDPWGSPFHFQLKGDGRSGSKLYIWSNGENGLSDVKDTESMIKNGFANGDDILISISI